jgi:hypothetical protein
LGFRPNSGVNIETDSLLLSEGMTYQFGLGPGTVNAFYSVNSDRGINFFPKTTTDTGSLLIKKFDQVNKILSGTFSFSGSGSNGIKVYITEGRFDIQY